MDDDPFTVTFIGEEYNSFDAAEGGIDDNASVSSRRSSVRVRSQIESPNVGHEPLSVMMKRERRPSTSSVSSKSSAVHGSPTILPRRRSVNSINVSSLHADSPLLSSAAIAAVANQNMHSPTAAKKKESKAQHSPTQTSPVLSALKSNIAISGTTDKKIVNAIINSRMATQSPTSALNTTSAPSSPGATTPPSGNKPTVSASDTNINNIEYTKQPGYQEIAVKLDTLRRDHENSELEAASKLAATQEQVEALQEAVVTLSEGLAEELDAFKEEFNTSLEEMKISQGSLMSQLTLRVDKL